MNEKNLNKITTLYGRYIIITSVFSKHLKEYLIDFAQKSEKAVTEKGKNSFIERYISNTKDKLIAKLTEEGELQLIADLGGTDNIENRLRTYYETKKRNRTKITTINEFGKLETKLYKNKQISLITKYLPIINFDKNNKPIVKIFSQEKYKIPNKTKKFFELEPKEPTNEEIRKLAIELDRNPLEDVAKIANEFYLNSRNQS